MTVGDKIKKARMLRGLTQAELGAMVGMPGDRLRQYECDVRKPKPDKMDMIAKALNVDIHSLSEPDTVSDYGIMHLLFELEETKGLNIIENEGLYYLSFRDPEDPMKNKNLKEYMEQWYQKKSELLLQANDSPETTQKKKTEYDLWKMRFPLDNVEEASTALSLQARKRKLEQELAQVNQEINKRK